MSKQADKGGIGFLGALFLLFLGLKLGGVIDWPWIWIFAPIWAPIALVFVIFAVMCIIVGLAGLIKD